MVEQPIRTIHSIAPIRVCDNGGWSDTWFARRGKVFSIAVSPYVEIPEALWWELQSRLVLIFVGSSHSSSEVHLMVIRCLERAGMDSPKLEAIRRCAVEAKDALYAGDLEALGRALTRNTEAQAELHPDLVGPHHRKVIEIAREHHAAGWKVNGAGGDGGSVAILSHPDRARRRQMIRAIVAANPCYRHIPVLLSGHGLRVWETMSPAGADAHPQ